MSSWLSPCWILQTSELICSTPLQACSPKPKKRQYGNMETNCGPGWWLGGIMGVECACAYIWWCCTWVDEMHSFVLAPSSELSTLAPFPSALPTWGAGIPSPKAHLLKCLFPGPPPANSPPAHPCHEHFLPTCSFLPQFLGTMPCHALCQPHLVPSLNYLPQVDRQLNLGHPDPMQPPTHHVQPNWPL